MGTPEQYLRQNKERYMRELFAFLRIPSISMHSKHREDMRRAAEWLADSLRQAGLEHVALLETEGNPVVYGDWLHAEGKPTVLIYGHYDVQPPDPLAEWASPPFEPEIRGGNLYARGATDDKGQLFIHIKTVEAFLQTEGKLPVNIKFCLEGEEEISSPHLEPLLVQEKERFQADAVVVSDTSFYEQGLPAIHYGLRGICGMQIEVSAAKNDLHSGEFGGGVANPIHELARLIATFHDAEGKVAVNGFYDQVRLLAEEEREQIRKLGFDEEKLKDELGVPAFFGEPGYSFLERTWARPTLEVNAISGGSQDEGLKSIVPAKAWAKVSCRLVPDQNPEQIQELLERHIAEHTPAHVRVKTVRLTAASPYYAAVDNPFMQAGAEAYRAVYNVRPVFTRAGGSIPIMEAFHRLFGCPVVTMGFGLPGENLHAPNEFLHVDNFYNGMLVMADFWRRL
ncbi:MAG TPA: dipeptidase [Bacilli bacterium]